MNLYPKRFIFLAMSTILILIFFIWNFKHASEYGQEKPSLPKEGYLVKRPGSEANQQDLSNKNPDKLTLSEISQDDSPQLIDLRQISLAERINAQNGSEEEQLRKALELDDHYQFNSKKATTDRKGNKHTRYQQYYRGVPVWGENILVHRDIRGKAYAVNGSVAMGIEKQRIDNNIINLSGVGKNQLENALKFVQSKAGHLESGWSIINSKSQSVLYFEKQTSQYVPAYFLSYLAENTGHTSLNSAEVVHDSVQAPSVTRPHYIVDAQSLEILKKWEGLNTAEATGPGGNRLTGKYYYGTDFPALQVTQVGEICYMEDEQIKTVNVEHREFEDIRLANLPAWSFTCPENSYKPINGAYSPLNDAHFFSHLTLDMYEDWLGVSPFSGQLPVNVHYGFHYWNAFWSGEGVYFGDGTDISSARIPIVGHEISHGFTEFNSGLIYSGQSGGLNESFSDIAGVSLVYFRDGVTDWDHGVAGRSFIEPTRRGTGGIGHLDDYYDGVDVHASSGISNHAFYLLATSFGWTIPDAFEVYATANQNYWVPNETFVGGACGVMNAAGDLGFDAIEIQNAFYEVGVVCPDPPFVDTDGDAMDDRWEQRVGLNPDSNDAADDPDEDGIPNVEEYQLRTLPFMSDSDNDGVNDSAEIKSGTNPLSADSDRDGLSDSDELLIGLDPSNPDTDEDGMFDGWELSYEFNPLDASDAEQDFDEDGLINRREFEKESSPLIADSDGDMLTDLEEANLFSNPNSSDTDGDGLSDFDEVNLYATDLRDSDFDNDQLMDSVEIELGTDPLNSDSDGDGLEDGDEVYIYSSNPLIADSDSDGMPDNWEVEHKTLTTINDATQDPDEDGLSNLEEYENSADPHKSDTDEDGLSDFEEVVTYGTLANDSDSDDDNIPDFSEVFLDLNPVVRDEYFADSDKDGWTNYQEYKFGSHPKSSDTVRNDLQPKPLAASGKTFVPEILTNCLNNSIEDYNHCKEAYGWKIWDRVWVGLASAIQVENADNYAWIGFQPGVPWQVQNISINFGNYGWFSAVNRTELIFNSFDVSFDINKIINWQDLDEFESDSILATEDLTTGENYGEFTFTLDAVRTGLSFNLNQNALDSFNEQPGALFQFSLVLSDPDWQGVNREYIVMNSDAVQIALTYQADTDSDGMPDLWEDQHGLDKSDPDDALQDYDSDNLINLQEFLHSTNPSEADSDGDEMPDRWEIENSLNPIENDAEQDKDEDGLNNLQEFLSGTNPGNIDTDNDGMPDQWETDFALDPNDASDAALDLDGDGLSNLEEFNMDRDPTFDESPIQDDDPPDNQTSGDSQNTGNGNSGGGGSLDLHVVYLFIFFLIIKNRRRFKLIS